MPRVGIKPQMCALRKVKFTYSNPNYLYKQSPKKAKKEAAAPPVYGSNKFPPPEMRAHMWRFLKASLEACPFVTLGRGNFGVTYVKRLGKCPINFSPLFFPTIPPRTSATRESGVGGLDDGLVKISILALG